MIFSEEGTEKFYKKRRSTSFFELLETKLLCERVYVKNRAQEKDEICFTLVSIN